METVVIVESVYEKGKAVFDGMADLHIVVAPEEEAGLARVVSQHRAVGVVLGIMRYTHALYECLPKGGIIARFGVGYDGVDLRKAQEKGVLVTNTPGVLAQTVAESTVLLAGECLRKFGSYAAKLRAGKWAPAAGREFYGKTWAIVGLGDIGRQVAKILSFGFGVDVVSLKRESIDTTEAGELYGIKGWYDDFEKLVEHADIVSIHLPANTETYHYMDHRKLASMRSQTLLINTSRGALVDEVALYDAISEGRLWGAGLDVFENEPYQPVGDKDLRKLEQVVMTPHIGSNTDECNWRMAKRVLHNICAAVQGDIDALDLVNS